MLFYVGLQASGLKLQAISSLRSFVFQIAMTVDNK